MKLKCGQLNILYFRIFQRWKNKYFKNMTKIHYPQWLDSTYKVYTGIITKEHILSSLKSLWGDIHKNESLLGGKAIIIQFKVELSNGLIRSISHLQTVSLQDSEIEVLFDIFNEYWNIRSQEYKIESINTIIYTYKILFDTGPVVKRRINRAPSLKPAASYSFKGYDLPNTMDFTEWGIYYIDDDYKTAIVNKPNSKAKYYITLYEKHQTVQLKIGSKLLLAYKDIMSKSGDLNSFSRTIFLNKNNQEHVYTFIDRIQVVKTKTIPTKFLKTILPSTYITNKFLTLDIETRTLNGIMTPYCVSIFNGLEKVSFYLTDYINSDLMLEAAINSLFRRKYHLYKVYIHNFSYFDSVFMLRVLSNMNIKITPIIRDGRIINLTLSSSFVPQTEKSITNKGGYIISIRDSFLMLPSSLAKLAVNFNVEKKGIFPYKFVNNDQISLDYIGDVPSFDDFSNITDLEYHDYKKNFKNRAWDLKKESIQYCEQDVVTLYQIIDKFNHKIFKLFRVDILKYPTLSSLAFAIYRSQFMGEAKIPLIHGELFNFFREGYTGGSVDVIIPEGVNIKRYDVNSLYPYIMKTCPMPVGNITYFDGDITEIDHGAFGIFEVEVTSPNYLEIPILQLRVKGKNSVNTVSPLGSWTGVYFSEEIYNAMRYGYKFKILRGYTFEKGFIFKEYVDFLYKLKMNSFRDSPDYIISKLLLNSLYGRLGMNPKVEEHKIIKSSELIEIQNTFNVSNIIDFKNGTELVSFFDDTNIDTNLNISVPVSIAVTAMARVYMTKFKNDKNIELLYFDTDSIDIKGDLNYKYIGKEIGKFKLEHIFKKAIFLAPKVYGGITDNYEYIKVKGLKNPIPFKDLEKLIFKDTRLEIDQTKWYRNFNDGTINIKKEIYTLITTDNKRNIIYDKNNKFIATKPIILEYNSKQANK
jgi:hypothetical protein